MTVTMTSEAFGKVPGDSFTGTASEEAWLIAEGYAKNAANTGGVPNDIAYAGSFSVDGSNDNQVDYTGALKADGLVHLTSPVGVVAPAVLPADDPTLATNRADEPQWPSFVAPLNDGFANDSTNLAKGGKNPVIYPDQPYDFDAAGVDGEKPSNLALAPDNGLLAGGTVVTITGLNLKGVTGVTFGGTAGTALDVSKAADGVIKVTTPAKTAGAVDVVVTDNIGSTTLTAAFTYHA